MAASPDRLIDATIRHQVFLERLKSGEVSKFAPFLREMDRSLREVLTRDQITTFQRQRVEAMVAQISSIMRGIFDRFGRELQGDLFDLATYEAGFEARALRDSVEGVEFNVPAPEQIRAAVLAAPLASRGLGQGKLLAPFLDGWTGSEIERLTGVVRQGFFEGRTNADMIREIRGTVALRFGDGELARVNRNASTIIRTAVQHVASTARMETWQANADIVKSYRWSSTLDQRTSNTCKALDRRVFKVGKGPVPPAHPNCRSATIGMVDERYNFLDEGAQRASINGPVSAEESYMSWLKKQPGEFQDAAIGPVRAKLLRDGGLTAERFAQLQLDRNFQPLTLDQMRQLEPLAFTRAGL